MLFAVLAVAKIVNSITSFGLIVFTIPLAFDVGGRDCGLVTLNIRLWLM
jgi:hypothetical protein